MDVIPFIIQLVVGAGAAVLAGKLISRIDEGLLINAAVGAGGGLVAGQILGTVAGWFVPEAAASLSYTVASVVGGIAGGGGLLLLAGSIGRGPMARAGTRQ